MNYKAYFATLLIIALLSSCTTSQPNDISLSEENCSIEYLGSSIPVSRIAEPVSRVLLESPQWFEETQTVPAHCSIKGAMHAVDQSATAQVISFEVLLPAIWSHHSIQKGGAGMNGVVPNLSGKAGEMFGGESDLLNGFATYGSDSGHNVSDASWLLNDEAIQNLGYMQMKKTHDAAMVLMERAYGAQPIFNYYIGGSQGGREALTVAQRYPEDYEGIVATVPIVNFSNLMLAPTLTRIQENSLKYWVPENKGRAIAAEFMRQCDNLDGLVDGVINNYVACREIFNKHERKQNISPWASKLCRNNVDANPEDDSETACFTEEQIETLDFVFSDFEIGLTLANDVTRFGMWSPTSGVAGGGFFGGLFTGNRFKGQEGASEDAPVWFTLGVEGVTGIVMQNPEANPLDYGNGSQYVERRLEISQWLDATDPDLSAFSRRGGKLLVIIGTDDTVASTGAQLNYYQSLLDTMGRDSLDSFARLWVVPQTGHGVTGTSYELDGEGNTLSPKPIPSSFDRLEIISHWVEENSAPGKSITLDGPVSSLPMCSYPQYPFYQMGDVNNAESYTCMSP